MIVKALSVKEPWASMIRLGKKKIEFRTWYRNYRGRLLIVASKSPRILLCGHAVCFVDLVHWRKPISEDRDNPGCPLSVNLPGYYSLVLEKPNPILVTFPVRGRLGLYDVELPEELCSTLL